MNAACSKGERGEKGKLPIFSMAIAIENSVSEASDSEFLHPKIAIVSPECEIFAEICDSDSEIRLCESHPLFRSLQM